MHGFIAYPHMIGNNKLSQCKNPAASRPNNHLASSRAVKINEVFLLSEASVAIAILLFYCVSWHCVAFSRDSSLTFTPNCVSTPKSHALR